MKKILPIILILSLFLTGCGKEEILDGSVDLDLTIQEREGAIGKSNKDFTELTNSKPSTVRNDVTEKWRKITLSKSIDINEYLLSYNKLYMTDEPSAVHWIINFNHNTTTSISDMGDYLYVTVHEYVDKEEHDAKVLGNGMVIGEFNIYKDNGDIMKAGD